MGARREVRAVGGALGPGERDGAPSDDPAAEASRGRGVEYAVGYGFGAQAGRAGRGSAHTPSGACKRELGDRRARRAARTAPGTQQGEAGLSELVDGPGPRQV